ncbi:MAG: PKD domain-containing protein, partial [Candidatus Heimdallarchaeaceae archaeon]
VGIKVVPSPEVTLTFSEVTETGYTYVTVDTENPGFEIPGFQFLGTYYNITTSASYTGPVTISIAYDDTSLTLEEEKALQLLHFDGIISVDVTTNIDTTNNIIYGSVSSFSWFGIGFSSNIPLTMESITGPLGPIKIGDPVQVTGTFTNPDSFGAHVATFDWGDGEISQVNIDPGVRTVTNSHAYTLTGVYAITLTISNNEGESDSIVFEYAVIYDPDGGFVTGGGWIESPPGAYTADPDLYGRANFGFVAKYKKGTTIPTGNTVFQFHAGDLNFQAESYDWLVIAGARGKFKGIGTINGEGMYKFMLTAVDGALTGEDGVDKFRIKIWVEDEETGEELIIYDNMLVAEDDSELDWTTEIGGGSIVIHKSKPIKLLLNNYPTTEETSISMVFALLSILSLAILDALIRRKTKKQ